ncbi:MAG: ComEC/Rec2 family competence protein [Propionibacteriales bacterium]|nr:ComEC/Rec2 family competence protein [Propionibacteriales bacterium]
MIDQQVPSGLRAADLRALALASCAWAAALASWSGAGQLVLLVAVAGAAGTSWGCWRGGRWLPGAAVVLVLVGGCISVALARAATQESPVHRLAATSASVTAVVRLASDPVLRTNRFGSRTTAEAAVLDVRAPSLHLQLDVPVLLVLGEDAAAVRRGTVLRVRGTLRPSDRPERAAVLQARTAAQVLAPPSGLTAVGNRVRRAVREAVADQPPGPRALVPALVDGQDGDLPTHVVDDFRTTGMTHLLAVSGTNLTLMVGFLLVLARWIGVRGYALVGVGLVGVAGFLVLAGSEPSVLRAAAMGVVALVGLSAGGRQRGLRALGIGVLLLVLAAPGLARSVGFALSVVATAAILLLVPRWRAALARWLPRWLAEAIAVPLAAQLACTPLVAAISGQVSLVAVGANLLAAPLVAPATVLGLLGGLVALVQVPAAQVVAAPAGWAAQGLIAIAERGAALPVPALAWSGSPTAIGVLSAAALVGAAGLHRLLARRGSSLLAVLVMVAAVLVPLPTPGWPPPGWVAVICSVGQGDGIVLRVSERAAVVVDAGPEPDLIDGCLRRLGIRTVPVVVLTHFHADHVDGLPGVLRGRRVGEIVTTSLADPVGGAAQVQRIAGRAGIGGRALRAGEVTTLGALRWQVLAPSATTYPDSESPPNDASVVLLVEVAGVRLLLSGDQERPSQAELHQQYPGLRADVLKVAHHGSSKQDEDLVRSLGARVALISVGAGNDYGHPAVATLDLLRGAGLQVHRTDVEGDLAVTVSRSGALATVVRPSGVRPP